MIINICLVSDNNYIKYLASSLVSILKNADINDILNIFIIVDDISDNNKNKILNLASKRNCEIKFIKIDTDLFDNFPNYKISAHITKMSYARLLLAQILKDVDKIIYLDCDTTVLVSLKEFFKTNIDDYYIAAAEDIGLLYNIKTHGKFYENFKVYINSGVLLMNLKLWRQDNLSNKLINSIQEHKEDFMLGDQDALNFVCGDKIKIIDFSYNLQIVLPHMRKFIPKSLKRTIKDSIKNPKIIHYCTHSKPWNSYVPLKKYYLKYEKTNPFNTENYFKLKCKHLIFFLKWLLRKPYHLLKKFFI